MMMHTYIGTYVHTQVIQDYSMIQHTRRAIVGRIYQIDVSVKLVFVAPSVNLVGLNL